MINNAGLWRGLNEAGLLHCSDDVWDTARAVNVTGTLHCYQAAVPVMSEHGWGRVVNISSMASWSGGNAYGLTKHAVEHMTKGMAREVGDMGIIVNCIAPGISAFERAKESLPNAAHIVVVKPESADPDPDVDPSVAELVDRGQLFGGENGFRQPTTSTLVPSRTRLVAGRRRSARPGGLRPLIAEKPCPP